MDKFGMLFLYRAYGVDYNIPYVDKYALDKWFDVITLHRKIFPK